ncbi:hypothetical protein HDU84_005121 [Entophlyctis sp. JEL0112]|nr:hypothetical protein HDU84_005121 [Entophlyctis sp. JEL0112]
MKNLFAHYQSDSDESDDGNSNGRSGISSDKITNTVPHAPTDIDSATSRQVPSRQSTPTSHNQNSSERPSSAEEQQPQIHNHDNDDNSAIHPILPPALFPAKECDPALQAKVEKWTQLRVQSGRRFNDQLMRTPSFANPSIMSKLIEFLGLDEHGSNMPNTPEFPAAMFYDEIGMVGVHALACFRFN